MFILKKYQDIYDIAKNENSFIVDLSKLDIKQRLRVIDFLLGLSFKNGSLEKLNNYTFDVVVSGRIYE